MSELRRIMVSVPSSLLQEIDGMVSSTQRSRSELIRTALRMYLDEKTKLEIRDALRRGYVDMAEINLALAEGGPVFGEGPELLGVKAR